MTIWGEICRQIKLIVPGAHRRNHHQHHKRPGRQFVTVALRSSPSSDGWQPFRSHFSQFAGLNPHNKLSEAWIEKKSRDDALGMIRYYLCTQRTPGGVTIWRSDLAATIPILGREVSVIFNRFFLFFAFWNLLSVVDLRRWLFRAGNLSILFLFRHGSAQMSPPPIIGGYIVFGG